MDKNIVKMSKWKEFFEEMSKMPLPVHNFPNKAFHETTEIFCIFSTAKNIIADSSLTECSQGQDHEDKR